MLIKPSAMSHSAACALPGTESSVSSPSLPALSVPEPSWRGLPGAGGSSAHLRLVRRSGPVCLLALLLLAGCTRASGPQDDASASGPTQQRQTPASQLSAARDQLDQIPPPSKSRYLAIHTVDRWSNPFLIVGKKNVTLRIYYPDAAANGTLPGNMLPNTMLRPAGARKRELDLRPADLPEALAALPPESWGYGRVVAVEEDPSTLRPDRPQMRRNVETIIQMLNDLGIVVDDWPGTGLLR